MSHWCKLLLALSALWVQAAQANEPAPASWPAEARRDAQWLTAGVDRFPALLKRSEQIKVEGTAILVPDAGKQAISPAQMMFLRNSLAEYGWDTLLISPPNWPELAQTKEGWKLYQSSLQQRLQAALERAASLPGNKLIIGEGATAASLMSLFSEGKMRHPDALVVLSPYLPDPALNDEVASWYGLSDYPLLDVYTPLDNRWAAATVKARATAASKRVRLDYRQLKMAVPPPNQSSLLWLTRQIHGWVDQLGW